MKTVGITTQEPKHIDNRKKVLKGSVIGTTLGIAAGVAGVCAMAKKGNPAFAIKNIAYKEKDVLLIGTTAILGGLAGGLITDKNKKNITPKIREASHQFVGNTLFPITFLAIGNKILDKTNFKLPQIKSNSKAATIANGVLKNLPRIITTGVSLLGGAHIGNKVVSAVNEKIYKQKENHCVKAEDMLVHTDDICLATSMIFKDTPKISSFTNVILPATFIVPGVKTGIKECCSSNQ